MKTNVIQFRGDEMATAQAVLMGSPDDYTRDQIEDAAQYIIDNSRDWLWIKRAMAVLRAVHAERRDRSGLGSKVDPADARDDRVHAVLCLAIVAFSFALSYGVGWLCAGGAQ